MNFLMFSKRDIQCSNYRIIKKTDLKVKVQICSILLEYIIIYQNIIMNNLDHGYLKYHLLPYGFMVIILSLMYSYIYYIP